MLVTYPGDRVRDLKNIFNSVFGRPERIAHGSEAGDINESQSRRVHIAAVGKRNADLLGRVLAEQKRQRVYRVAKEAPVGIIEQSPGKGMCPPEANVLRSCFIATWTAV